MNRDNISAAAMAIAVVAVIVGFGIYFNSPSLNKASSSSQQQLEKVISTATTTNGTIKTIKLDKTQFLQIDKSQFQKAPEFAQIAGYINTNNAPLTLAGLKGKVVLVDFWTYSCINCIRTLPHLRAWYATYHKDGFEIVGVHTPEFAFEHVLSNVRQAARDLHVSWPVALDNKYKTWNAYSNEYWPAEYFIDKLGHVRHEHFGEGEYGQTEADIRALLAE